MLRAHRLGLRVRHGCRRRGFDVVRPDVPVRDRICGRGPAWNAGPACGNQRTAFSAMCGDCSDVGRCGRWAPSRGDRVVSHATAPAEFPVSRRCARERMRAPPRGRVRLSATARVAGAKDRPRRGQWPADGRGCPLSCTCRLVQSSRIEETPRGCGGRTGCDAATAARRKNARYGIESSHGQGPSAWDSRGKDSRLCRIRLARLAPWWCGAPSQSDSAAHLRNSSLFFSAERQRRRVATQLRRNRRVYCNRATDSPARYRIPSPRSPRRAAVRQNIVRT